MPAYQSPPYMLPLQTSLADFPEACLAALRDIETQFDLPTAKLNEIVEQFMWEFGKGLAEEATDETRDTFM